MDATREHLLAGVRGCGWLFVVAAAVLGLGWLSLDPSSPVGWLSLIGIAIGAACLLFPRMLHGPRAEPRDDGWENGTRPPQ